MKRPLAAVATVVLMGGLLWLGARRPESDRTTTAPAGSTAPTSGAAVEHPAEACVRTLLESAARGDVDGYLDSFTTTLRARFEREAAERGRDRFAADLSRSATARKSHAVFAAEAEGPEIARVVVESVYPDRNERQTYRVEQQPEGDWLVADVATVRSVQPKAKFGAPASFVAPEGVPVQGSAGSSDEPGPQ